MLSEDLVCCRPATAEALPGPALLRIRPDASWVYLRAYPLLLNVPIGLVGFDAKRAGTSAPVPIQAIVFRVRSRTNSQSKMFRGQPRSRICGG